MSETAVSDSNGELWLFGYGSLIWKPPPHFDLRIPGYITGYTRRFWQASEDHRGTPSSPGRVVTLIERAFWATTTTTTTGGPEEEEEAGPARAPDRVYGASYRIPARHVKAVQAYLDLREINGYSIRYTTFFPCPSLSSSSAASSAAAVTSTSPSTSSPHPIENCLVYIGLPWNPQFLGRQAPQEVAEVIARSKGPSGANAEYLFMLEDALRELGEGSGDEHVGDLAERVRSLLNEGNETGDRSGDGKVDCSEVKTQAVEHEIGRLRSGEDGRADEETEKVSPL